MPFREERERGKGFSTHSTHSLKKKLTFLPLSPSLSLWNRFFFPNFSTQATADSALALGRDARSTQPSSVAIGAFAEAVAANTIVLSATGASWSPSPAATASAFYVRPVRGVALSTPTLVYNTATGEITYNTSSRRYKMLIQSITDAVAEAVWRLRPVTFVSAADGPDGPLHYGFIAEEVDEVDPLLSYRVRNETTGAEVVEGVLQDRIVPLLLHATRRMKEEHGSELAALRQESADQEQRLAALRQESAAQAQELVQEVGRLKQEHSRELEALRTANGELERRLAALESRFA